jgi:hypothetical protein
VRKREACYILADKTKQKAILGKIMTFQKEVEKEKKKKNSDMISQR